MSKHQAERLAAREGVEYRVETNTVGIEAFEEARVYNGRVAGIVIAAIADDDGSAVLFVHHEDYDGWVLPGGDAEPGEDLREAAAREVAEETGVTATIDRPLLVIEFVTRHKGRTTSVHLVLFEGSTEDERTGDDLGLEYEAITEARWMDTIPNPIPDDETVRRTTAIVADRFGLDDSGSDGF